MKRKTAGTAAAALVAAALALGWSFAPRPIDVEVATAERGRFEQTLDEDGRTRLRDRYVVSAPLAGRIARIALREGDAVVADAVVARIAPALPQLLDERTVLGQQARVEAAEAQIARAAVRIDRAQVGAQQARNELARSEQLAQRGFVAPTKLEGDRLAVQAAEKELEGARQDRHVAEHELGVARAALATVRQGGAPRAFEVRAPISGAVLRVSQPSEGVVALGAPLLELGDLGALEVVLEMLTGDASRTKPGDRVRIERWGGPGALEGRVRRIEPSAFTKVSALGVEEQRVRVLVDLVDPPQARAGLGDGWRVTGRVVVLAADDALRVPTSAVFPRPQAGEAPPGDAPPPAGDAPAAVFRVDDGRARLVPVTVRARGGALAWIAEGLSPGDTVVTYPPASLRDGARVRLRAAP